MYTKDQLYAYARKRRLRDTDIGTSSIYRDLNGLGYLAPEHAVGTVPGYVFDDDSRTILSRVRGGESAGVTRIAPQELSFLASEGTEQDQVDIGTSVERATRSQTRLQLKPGHASLAARSTQPRANQTYRFLSRTARLDLDESGDVLLECTDEERNQSASGESTTGLYNQYPVRVHMNPTGIDIGATLNFDTGQDTSRTVRMRFADGTVSSLGHLARNYFGGTFYSSTWNFSHLAKDAVVSSGGNANAYQFRYTHRMRHPGSSRWFPFAQLLPSNENAGKVVQTLSCYVTTVGPEEYVIQGIYGSSPAITVGQNASLVYQLRILFVRTDLWE